MPASTTAAFFDLDGTLCTGHIWRGLARYCRANGINRRTYYTFMGTHLALWALHKLGLVAEERFLRTWGTDMAILLKGLSQEQGRDLFRAIIKEEITPTLRPDVLEALRWHQQRGHLVLLASGTFQELLEMIAEGLGVEHAVGSHLEAVDGRYAGRIRGPSCFGNYKARLVQNYLATRGLPVDWASSYAYADRIYDRPMLELVGNPVAVYPDHGLLAHARQSGWRVVEGATAAAQGR